MEEKPIAAGRSSFDLVDADAVFAELDLKSDTVLYDLACGAGNYSLEAARRMGEGRVHALDLWPEGIAALKKEVEERGLKNVSPLCCDVSGSVPLADDSVDICLMATVLHDLAAEGVEGGTLREVARVLKPDGRLAVIEFDKVDRKPGPPVEIRMSEREVEAALSPFGLKRERLIRVGPQNYMMTFVAG